MNQTTGAPRRPRRVMLLDYDGVLVDSQDLAGRLFIQALNSIGFYQLTSPEEVVDLCDGNVSDKLQKAGLTPAQISEAYRLYADNMNNSTEKTPLFPGVQEALANLYPDYFLHIVSSSSHAVIAATIQEHQIPWIDGIWGMDDEPSKVKKIAHIRQLHPGLPAFFLGDTRGDMVESHEAGVVAIAATWGWHRRERIALGHPDYYVDNISQLPPLLGQLPDPTD